MVKEINTNFVDSGCLHKQPLFFYTGYSFRILRSFFLRPPPKKARPAGFPPVNNTMDRDLQKGKRDPYCLITKNQCYGT